ncbi:hypothetical protein FOL47_005805 [Perkinsus chesapeaki]|uniref:UBC core domain-containing protein n=1 Tax=Perkinsus chesapeaki TaxID=330153 RepID=A0A7J6LVJ7_PERCH|nr:hypothetical protein FOL47_005805 [Perkinsus chesapeaki]
MSVARELLKKQLIELTRDDSCGFSVGLEDDSDFFKWRVCFEGPPDSLYEGGLFTAILQFPEDFPNNPPDMRFETPMWHPNVYPDGRVCISILHPPGTDQFNELESADERWRPILSVESILVSVISMLASPNLDSPANVDAAVEYKKDYPAYKKKVRRLGEWQALKERVLREGGDEIDIDSVDLELLEFLRDAVHGLEGLPMTDYQRLCLAFQDCSFRAVSRGWSTSSVSRMYSIGLEHSNVLMSFIKGQLREYQSPVDGEQQQPTSKRPRARNQSQRDFVPSAEIIDFSGLEGVDESDRGGWDLVIDAEWIGNEGRFANHGDDPNASFVLRTSQESHPSNPMLPHDSLPFQCMSLVAIKPIRRRQEILVHYGPTYWENVMNSEQSLTEKEHVKINRTSAKEGYQYYDGVLLDGGFVSCEAGCEVAAMKEAFSGGGEYRAVMDENPLTEIDKGVKVDCCEVNHPAYPGFKLVATKEFHKGDFICVYGGVLRRMISAQNNVMGGHYQMDVGTSYSGAFAFRLDEDLQYCEVQRDYPVFSPRLPGRKVLRGGAPTDLSNIKKIGGLDRSATHLLCHRLQQPEWWDVIINCLKDADIKSPKQLSGIVRHRLSRKLGRLPPNYPREVAEIDLDDDD